MAQKPVVLVTGATGRAGLLAVARLEERGMAVRALSRNAARARKKLEKLKVEGGVEEGDVGDRGVVRKAVQGVSCILFAAGGDHADYRLVNFKGVQYCAEEGKKAGVKSMVVISAAWVTQPYSLLSYIVNSFFKGYPMALHLMGENRLRASQISYCIIRAGNVVPDGKGVPQGVKLAQGDTLGFVEGGTPGLGYTELAEACVQGLDFATDNHSRLTFEMTSSNSNAPPGKDTSKWVEEFKRLDQDAEWDPRSGFNDREIMDEHKRAWRNITAVLTGGFLVSLLVCLKVVFM